MTRFIVLTFAFLAWGFWELSDGSDFVPETRVSAQAADAPAAEDVLVTRASTSNIGLSSEAAPVAEIVQASLNQPGGAEPPVVETAPLDSPAAAQEDATAPEEPQVILFESLVEGAPSVADILPDSEIAVILPEGTAIAPEPVAAVSGQIRQVSGNRVNMRAGPGTTYGVVTTLSRGTDVEVFEVNANGWARLRNVATGQEGWMAERLLTGG